MITNIILGNKFHCFILTVYDLNYFIVENMEIFFTCFLDFPLSQTVQNVLDSICGDFPNWFPCISGFRIGSHATRTEMKGLTSEGLLMKEKNLIYRGILQCYINQGM